MEVTNWEELVLAGHVKVRRVSAAQGQVDRLKAVGRDVTRGRHDAGQAALLLDVGWKHEEEDQTHNQKVVAMQWELLNRVLYLNT